MNKIKNKLTTLLTKNRFYTDSILNSGKFYFKYQPIVDIDRNIVSMEALLRFNNIDDVEDIFHNLELDGRVTNLTIPTLNLIIEDIKKMMLLGINIPVSFNLSVSQLNESGIAEKIVSGLLDNGIQKSLIIIEITEHYLRAKKDTFTENLNVFIKSGIRLRMDDFGKGYSSLTSLNTLNFSGVKVDKSFIHQMFTNKLSFSIVKAITQMGEYHDFCVITEGVETEQQFEKLLSINVKLFQGYLFGKPMGLHEIIKLIEIQEYILEN